MVIPGYHKRCPFQSFRSLNIYPLAATSGHACATTMNYSTNFDWDSGRTVRLLSRQKPSPSAGALYGDNQPHCRDQNF